MLPDASQEPNTGEIDCLAVLWEARAQDPARVMKLSEIHEKVAQRRQEFGEPPPALTTVSTYLRSALAKRLLVETRLDDQGKATPLVAVRTRGALSSSRSPKTAYRPAYEPGEVFRSTFQAIASSYPQSKRNQALVDFARAMDLPAETVKKIEKLLQGKSGS
jgi:predicted transcriptional regulator